MGLWWKKVQTLPKGKALTIQGQIGAPAKRWYNLWRFRLPYFIIDVHTNGSYVLYFSSTSQGVMQYWKVLNTPLVAVRIGPEPVTFLAHHSDGQQKNIEVLLGPLLQGHPYLRREDVTKV